MTLSGQIRMPESFLQDSRYFNSLAELYSELNEEDVLCGLWKRRCCAPETRAAVGWMQHGYLDTAQEALMQAMTKFANKGYDGRVSMSFLRVILNLLQEFNGRET